MKEKTINAKQLKTIISDISSFTIYKLMIPVLWGFWNTMACIGSIILEDHNLIIWITFMTAGLISHFALFYVAKKKKGYVLKIDFAHKWLWLFIIIVIVDISFIFPEISNIYNREFTLAFVVLLVGAGLCIGGKLEKSRFVIMIGIIWIITSNLFLIDSKYHYYLHGILSFITLIVLPTLFFLKLRFKK